MSKRDEFKNVEFEVKVFPKSNSRCDYERTCEFLSQIPFDLVELPVYSYNSAVFNDINLVGKLVVGYINGYNAEKRTFSVTIYEKFAKNIEEFRQPIIYARITNLSGNPIRLIGLDICPALYYSNIR